MFFSKYFQGGGVTSTGNRIRLVLSYLCGVGFVLSLGVHIASFRDLDLLTQYPILLGLHFLAIVAGFTLIAAIWLGQKSRQEIRRAYAKPGWLGVVVLILSAYVGIHFITSIPYMGSFGEVDGNFYKYNRGNIIHTYSTQLSYEQAKAKSELLTARVFSAMWLMFFVSIKVALLIEKRWLTSQDRVHAQLEAKTTQEQIEKGQAFEVGPESRLTFSQRLKATKWNLLRNVLTFQVVAAWLGGLIFDNGFFLFAGTFVCLGYLNYFYHRAMTRHYLTSLVVGGELCRLSALHFDELQHFDIPLNELRVTLEEQYHRGGPLYYLTFRQGNRVLFKQRSDIGYWTLERLQAVEKACTTLAEADHN